MDMDSFTRQILDALGWRAFAANHVKLAKGAGLELFWPQTGLVTHIWPGLKRLDWFTLDGKHQGALADFGNAPFPQIPEKRTRKGRQPEAGEFPKDVDGLDGFRAWTLSSVADLWVSGGKAAESTRTVYGYHLQPFCRRVGAKSIETVSEEDLEKALAETPQSAKAVCRRFITDVLALKKSGRRSS